MKYKTTVALSHALETTIWFLVVTLLMTTFFWMVFTSWFVAAGLAVGLFVFGSSFLYFRRREDARSYDD